MEKTVAHSSYSINANCPYCDEFLELSDELAESLANGDGFLRAEDIDEVVKCHECEKEFIITDIEF